MKRLIHARVLFISMIICLSFVFAAPAAHAASVYTTTGYRYSETVYNSTVSRYPEMMAKLSSKGTIAIPGLQSTHTRQLKKALLTSEEYMSDIACNDMVPQGICVTGNYILVTAYCCAKNPCPSSVYVIDRGTGEYRCTLSL